MADLLRGAPPGLLIGKCFVRRVAPDNTKEGGLDQTHLGRKTTVILNLVDRQVITLLEPDSSSRLTCQVIGLVEGQKH